MQLVNRNIIDTKDVESRRNKVTNDFDEAREVFHAKQRIGHRNSQWRKGDQWTDFEKNLFEKQQRVPYVFNYIKRYVDHMIGTQVQTRMDAKLLPREPGDENEVELLQHILKWTEQNSDIDIVETEVFEDGIVKGFGACSVRWQCEDLDFGYAFVEKIPFNQLYWDLNSKKKDKSDCSWMGRIQTTTKKEAGQMFPDKVEEIYSQNTQNSFVYNEKTLREIDALAKWNNEMVDIFEHYERYMVLEWLVSDELTGNITKFSDETEATDFFDGLITQYTADGTAIYDENGNQLVQIHSQQVNRIYQTVMVGNIVIRAYMTAMNDFPYVVYCPYDDDGDYTAVVNDMIHPQTMINRMLSQWDLQVGKQMKQGMTVIKNLLTRDFTIEDLRNEISKTATIIPVLNHQAINPLPNISVNPEMFAGIQLSTSAIESIAGGSNLNGTGESASESGKAAAIRAQQGGLARLPMYDNLRLWKKNVALRMVWWIKNYMSEAQIMRVIGQTDIPMVNLDSGYLDTLREIKVDITVDEAVNSATIKQQNVEQLTKILQTSGGAISPFVWLPILIKLSEFPQTEKEELLKDLDINKKYSESQAQLMEYQKLLKGVENSNLRTQLKQVEKQKEEIESAVEDIEIAKEELAKSQQELAAQKAMTPSDEEINSVLQEQQ